MLSPKDLAPGKSYSREEMVEVFGKTQLEKYFIWMRYLGNNPGLGSLANPRGLYTVLLNDQYGKELIREELKSDKSYLARKIATYDAVKDFLCNIGTLTDVVRSRQPQTMKNDNIMDTYSTTAQCPELPTLTDDSSDTDDS